MNQLVMKNKEKLALLIVLLVVGHKHNCRNKEKQETRNNKHLTVCEY